MPAFCRVVASVKASPDSDIGVEIWLPSDQWKGVFHGNGNGGYAGSLSAGYAGMEAGLRRGYASATTDMGTAPASTLNGDPLIGHPQKWKDWGMLSTHVMTVTGKAIAKAFYGEDAKHSYFTGCSTGGQQGLIEAQYYPEDYSGILVGAPVINRTWGHALAIWDYPSANLLPGHKLSDAKLALLHKAALVSLWRQEQWPFHRSLHRRSTGVQIRSRRADVQGRGFRYLPHCSRSSNGEGFLFGSGKSRWPCDLLWVGTGKRGAWPLRLGLRRSGFQW